MFAGQISVGASLSLTVTVKLHDGPAVVVQVTVVVPTLKDDPEAGVQVTVPQPAAVVGAGYVTLAAHCPAATFVVTLPGQLIVQAMPTVTVNEQLPELPDVSLAEQVTVVTPIGKLEPEAGVQVTDREPSQASLAVAVNVAVAEPEPAGLSVTLIGPGQVTTGPWLSLTVTVKLQDGPAVVEQVTVVVPFGKSAPLAGMHVTVPQFDPVVGAA